MSVETGYPHIVLDAQGRPTIENTSLKVIELIVEKLAYGWSPEELHFQHPQLTLGQIHAALTYYWDHAQAMDEEISEQLKKVDVLRKQVQASSPLKKRLKAHLNNTVAEPPPF